MSVISKIRHSLTRADGWVNMLTGLGNISRDKRLSTQFGFDAHLDMLTLASLYRDNDMGARIVEELPLDAFRQGFVMRPDGDDSIERGREISDHMEDSGALASLFKAAIWGRLFGGGAQWVIASGSGEQKEPLDLDRAFEIIGYKDFERQDLTVVKRYDDPENPSFGEPEIFRLNTVEQGASHALVEIHETRLILFDGIPEPRTLRQESIYGWGGASILQRAYGPLRGFGTFWDSLEHLIQDASQGVYKLSGLIDALASGNESDVVNRMEVADMGRSVVRGLVLDADGEDFQRQAYSFGGIGDVADRYAIRLAAAARMPVTKLFGQSPAGMNATGESDMALWYDQVSQWQESVLAPRLRRLAEIQTAANNGPTSGQRPDSLRIEFNPLSQPSEKEQAEIRKLQADIDVAYIREGVVQPEQVALSRFTETGYSTATEIDRDLYRDLLDRESESLKAAAGQPVAPALPPAE